MTSTCRELTLDELLAAPVTQAVMQADGLDTAGTKVLLLSIAEEIGYGTGPSRRGRAGANVLGRWLGARHGDASGARRQFCGAC